MSIARTAATGGELDPDFLRWQTSLPVDQRLLDVDVAGSIAHVQGLVAANLLTAEEGATLTAGLEKVREDVKAGAVELPLEEDVHMSVEALLAKEVGALSKKLHSGRSRNDQVATDLKLWSRSATARVAAGIDAVHEACHDFIGRYGEAAMPAYTHRQVAIPVLGRLWIDAALLSPLSRDTSLLSTVTAELAESPLGAGAIGGSTLPLRRDVTAQALGFDGPPKNPIDAIGQRDHALTLAFTCARIGLHLNRFCVDVVELASDGLVTLGGAVACGSSMMPHKRNPDLFELVRAQSALRQGELVALMQTFQGLGSGYHRDFQQDKQVLFSSVDGTVDCLKMIALGLRNIDLVPEKCMDALRQGDAVATDLTEALVLGGMSFRDAYGAVGALVARQRAEGLRLCDLTAEDLSAADLPTSLLELLDPAASATRRAAPFVGS